MKATLECPHVIEIRAAVPHCIGVSTPAEDVKPAADGGGSVPFPAWGRERSWDGQLRPFGGVKDIQTPRI